MVYESIEMGYFFAFTAGIFAFVSPYVFPLIPGYLFVITGFSFDAAGRKDGRARTGTVTTGTPLFFIIGFSTIFIILGLSATVPGMFLARYLNVIRQTGGVMVILLGLVLAGVLRWTSFFDEIRYTLQSKPVNLAGSFLVGTTFGVGWTPSVGPILASILIFAGTKNNLLQGFVLLSYYTLGLGLPLFLSSLVFHKLLTILSKTSQWTEYMQPVSGLCLTAMGVLIFFDLLEWLVPVTIG